MQEIIKEEIERKAKRILEKYRRGSLASQKYARKFTKRTGLPSTSGATIRPPYWDYHPHFDLVYCIKHSKYLARVIWQKIQAGTYSPVPAIQFQIPKPDGGTRDIMQFGIPDSAVSNIFHRTITARNSGIFSAYSFAYRRDKTIFEAVIHLSRMMKPSKSYILQYDYRKYFDTIDHGYLNKLIKQRHFVVTKAEQSVIEAFLNHEFAIYPSWMTFHYERRTVGVPQGS